MAKLTIVDAFAIGEAFYSGRYTEEQRDATIAAIDASDED